MVMCVSVNCVMVFILRFYVLIVSEVHEYVYVALMCLYMTVGSGSGLRDASHP